MGAGLPIVASQPLLLTPTYLLLLIYSVSGVSMLLE